MKRVLASLFIFAASLSQAVEFQCEDLAREKAQPEWENAFGSDFAQTEIIWSCKDKKNPNLEEIQFGDGSSLVGVSLEIVDGRCTVKDVYSGQDDQDWDPELDKELCLQ